MHDIPELAGVKVLVVDDNASVRGILKDLLSEWNMEPVTVGSVAETVRALSDGVESESLFRILLLDATMPEMDTVAAVEAITRHKRMKEASVILMGPPGPQVDRELSEKLESAHHLRKPVNPSELLETILTELRGQKTDQSRPAPVPHDALATGHLPLKILLVEDDLINQKVAAIMLGSQGHEVTIAGNGREALSLHGEIDFDLILMDVEMPEMDGIEATKAIRERERGMERHVPIIAMTAHAIRGDRERFLAQGMDGYMTKPINRKILFETIDTFAGRHKHA
jgi:CheY-like chemotaxis protein